MHLREAKPLPDDLKDFMDNAKEGVVYVSFGSQLRFSELEKKKVEIFVETFKRIKMSVLWKVDVTIPDLPKNVKTSSWVPQQDLLGHPNLKVFVTHGGLGSLQEAIYHKAVLVGIPFSIDQRPNLLRAAKHGYASVLEFDTLTADEFTKAINEGMKDDKMRSSLERIHNLYTDSQQRPVDTAAWWTEYVCRHKGARILQSAQFEDAPWYQYHHVDIIVFLVVVITALIAIVVLSCSLCCKICCSSNGKTWSKLTESYPYIQGAPISHENEMHG